MENVVRDIIANAERLYADGIRLRSLGSNRTANSLFVLAMEEAGKSCILQWLNFGYDKTKLLSELSTGHIEKQLIYMAYVYVKCLRTVATIVEHPNPPFFDFISKVPDLREGLAQEIHKQTPYHHGTLTTGLYDSIKQSGFYSDVSEDLDLKKRPFKDEFIVQHLEEDARDALAMARENTLIQRVQAAMYSNEVLIKPISGKQRREKLPDLIERLSNVNFTR